MTTVRKYSPIVDFEISEEGVFVYYADGKELTFDIEEYKEYLQDNEDLEPFTNDEGDVYDDGEGFYSPALTIDWVQALPNFNSLKNLKSFLKSQSNLVL
jgi:hypothetical protein